MSEAVPTSTPVTVPTPAPKPAEATVTPGGENIFTGNQRFEGFIGMGSPGNIKMPINLNTVQYGPPIVESPLNTEVIAFNYNAQFVGNFTGLGGPSPGWALGSSMFVQTGTAEGDGAGLKVLQALNVGAALRAPNANLEFLRGATIRANFFGATASGKVGQLETLRVARPNRVEGAVAGEVTGTLYGLFIESVAASTIPAAAKFSLYVEGGTSRFGGVVEVTNEIRNAGANALVIYSNQAKITEGTTLTLRQKAGGGGMVITNPTEGSFVELSDGEHTRLRISRAGTMEWGEGGAIDTTLARNAAKILRTAGSFQIAEALVHQGTEAGFFGHAAGKQPKGVAATAEAIIAALQSIGIFG